MRWFSAVIPNSMRHGHELIARDLFFVERGKKPVPNVDLSVSVRHHNVTKSDVVNVQAGIPIPVFNKNQGNIRSAQAEWVAACNEAKRIELELQDRLAVTYRQYAKCAPPGRAIQGQDGSTGQTFTRLCDGRIRAGDRSSS